MVICFLGPEGSGKGTQAALLADVLHIPHIIMGRLIDDRAQEQSPLGEKIREVRSTGQYLPDDMVVKILFDRLNQDDCKNGFIADGYPRRIGQAETLDTFLGQKGMQVDKLLVLEISQSQSIDRLMKRGRFDDTAENIKGRLSNYYANADAIMAHYQERDIVVKINGEQSVEAVHQAIKEIVA